MSEVASDPGAARFRIGTALGRTFVVLFRNIVPFGLLALIFNAPVQIYSAFFIGADVENLSVNWLSIAVATVVNILLGFLLSATLVYGTVLELRGGRAGIVECFVRGFRSLLPVIVVGILVPLIIGGLSLPLILLGFVVPLVLWGTVPAAIVIVVVATVMLWVAIPAAVVERPGIWASVTRSVDLTRGYRLKLFALLLILGVVTWLASVIVGGIVGFATVGYSDEPVSLFSGAESVSFAVAIVNVVIQAFTGALFAVASAVVYHDLRVAKEGIGAEQIAAVFD